MNQYDDLFSNIEKKKIKKSSAQNSKTADSPATYTATDIEVLEGLEPVRRRPGMYIGGTDERALHHLFAEIIDNSMDEAIAGYAKLIEVVLHEDGSLSVSDDGRGIPVDPHPKFPDKSALEVIVTTLHAGGKFDSKVYETSGGLHGVGLSVVNALSDVMDVEVTRSKKLYRQRFSRGVPVTPLETLGSTHNQSGTKICFHPDPEIFGSNIFFEAARLYSITRSKAYLFGGIKISWSCHPSWIQDRDPVPEKDLFYFPEGLKDYLSVSIHNHTRVTPEIFSGSAGKPGRHGSIEWALAWVSDEGFLHSYCNTIPTQEGGTHETGLRNVLIRGLRSYGELIGNKRAATLLTEDVMHSVAALLSVFIREPEFVGQTKDRLSSSEALRLVENFMRDAFDHWLAQNPQEASRLLEWVIAHADERTRRRQEREIQRKSLVRKLRLPGKLADCTYNGALGAELFIVEGDSAGGSAKQARDRKMQAILPLRGKILNVASAGNEKLSTNQQISDLTQALGCGIRSKYCAQDLRYSRVIIMTDADVDGAHIASLLITFFYQEMPRLIYDGHLFLAVPPLYRLSRNGKIAYATTDAHKEELLRSVFSGQEKVDISRFKGLGEMLPAQLRETTMDIKKRTLLKVSIAEEEDRETQKIVEELMGVKAETRFRFIQTNAQFAQIDHLDI